MFVLIYVEDVNHGIGSCLISVGEDIEKTRSVIVQNAELKDSLASQLPQNELTTKLKRIDGSRLSFRCKCTNCINSRSFLFTIGPPGSEILCKLHTTLLELPKIFKIFGGTVEFCSWGRKRSEKWGSQLKLKTLLQCDFGSKEHTLYVQSSCDRGNCHHQLPLRL